MINMIEFGAYGGSVSLTDKVCIVLPCRISVQQAMETSGSWTGVGSLLCKTMIHILKKTNIGVSFLWL